MQLASILGGDDLVMKPTQRQPIQHLGQEDSFGKRMGRKGEDLAVDALTKYATGAGATANPYAAGMMLGARALFGSDGMKVKDSKHNAFIKMQEKAKAAQDGHRDRIDRMQDIYGSSVIVNDGNIIPASDYYTQYHAEGSMNPVASAIMDRAELMETENALINDYENIKKYLYGGGQVKHYQEGTPAPVAPVQREMLPPYDGRYSYEYPTLGDANEDMGPQINPWIQEEPPVDTTRVPDFVKHPSTDNLIGYQTLGDANEDMGPQINPWEGSSVKPVSDGGMYEKQSKAYSPKEFSDMINKYLGS